MPVKNKDRDDLNTYRFHFVDGSTENFHAPDELIKTLAKPDKGGYHPIAGAADEWLINMDNVLWVENTTPEPPENNSK